MDQDQLPLHEAIESDDAFDRTVVDLKSVQATKVQGERLLEESRTLNLTARALLDEIDPSTV